MFRMAPMYVAAFAAVSLFMLLSRSPVCNQHVSVIIIRNCVCSSGYVYSKSKLYNVNVYHGLIPRGYTYHCLFCINNGDHQHVIVFVLNNVNPVSPTTAIVT